MDGRRFDHLARAAAGASSRRRALAALAAAALGALLGPDAAEAACRKAGEACGGRRRCCSGVCNGPGPCSRDGKPTGRCRCGCVRDGHCRAGKACRQGACVDPEPACGGAGQPCCAGRACDAGLACADGVCAAVTPAACGGRGEPCCGNGACLAGLGCADGVCAPCGEPEGPCCPGDLCRGGVCARGVCQEGCGGMFQWCCIDERGPDFCAAGLDCRQWSPEELRCFPPI